MPNVEIDGTNSTVKTNVLTSQSGTTITVPTGKVLTVTDAAGLTINGVAPLTSVANDAVTTAKIINNAVTLAKMAGGTDGQIITYDASGDPVAVGPGTDGQVLTSTGAGSPPAFEAVAAGSTTQIKEIYKNFDVSAATGSFAVTGVGFQPQFVYVQAAEHETLVQSWGFGTVGGASKFCSVNWRKADANGIGGVTTEIAYYWPNGSHRQLIDIASMDSDGATFGTLKVGSPTGTFRMYMYFMRFAS